jgi:hypothetical protein
MTTHRTASNTEGKDILFTSWSKFLINVVQSIRVKTISEINKAIPALPYETYMNFHEIFTA